MPNEEEKLIDDCWNHIGIWGAESPRCSKLDEVTHCQNCAIYSGSGRKLLDREPPDGYSNEWTKALEQKEDTSINTLISAIIFRIGDEWYSLKTNVLKEITEMRHVHSIPHRKNRVLRGITSVRGELYLCVSIGNLFDLDKSAMEDKNRQKKMYDRIIIIEKDTEQFVFPVSEILGIHHFSVDQIKSPPSTIPKTSSGYISGVIKHKDKHVGCINDELLFHALSRKIS